MSQGVFKSRTGMPVLALQSFPSTDSLALTLFSCMMLIFWSLSSSSSLGSWSGIQVPSLCDAAPSPVINPWRRDESQLFMSIGQWFLQDHLLCSQEGQRDVAELMLWHSSGLGKAVLVCGSEEWGPCWSLAGTANTAEHEALSKASVNMGLVSC